MRKVIGITIVFLGMTFSTHAEDTAPCAKISKHIVGQCFDVQGRLAFYNGTPSFRILVAGTKRLLGIADWWTHSNEEELPENVRALLPERSYVSETGIWGNYHVCPLEKKKKGSMQAVCIEHAEGLQPIASVKPKAEPKKKGKEK